MHRFVWLLAFLLLAAGGYLFYSRHAKALPDARPVLPAAQPLASGDLATNATADASTRSAPIDTPSMLTDPYARYDAATDLFPLMQELRERAERGDISGAAALAELEDECSMFISSQGDRSQVPRIMQKRKPSIKPWMDAMLARTATRCQRFTKSELEPRKQVHDRLVDAAGQGSASAKARLLMMNMDLKQIPDNVLVRTVNDIIASGDPAAFADLSNVMGVRLQGREQLFDVPAGSEVAGDAYLFAACELGLDCGPNSRILANLCFNGIGCGYPSIKALVQDTMLTPEYYRAMQKDVPLILAKVPHH
jgi:hypothetical protein